LDHYYFYVFILSIKVWQFEVSNKCYLFKCIWITQYFFPFVVHTQINQKVYTWAVHTQLLMWEVWIFNIHVISPHTCSNCPYALLIIIAKTSHTGNCKSLNSNSLSVGVIRVRGNSACSPLNIWFNIKASIMLYINFFTEA
jgi:hypothetical protein